VRRAGTLAALVGGLLLGALAGPASAWAADGCTVDGPYGQGRGQVWLLRPAGAPRSIVLFAHGWTAVDPNDWHRVRLDHLCARGSLVVFPRYQVDAYDTFEDGLDGFRQGVRTGFGRLGGEHLPLVAVGYSFGGALVNYYAANAARWGVPVPKSVLSIFPTTRMADRPVAKPPASVRFTILAGDRDEVVGTEGAKDFLAWLKQHPASRTTYRLVRSSAALKATHEALKAMTAASTRTFWAPIDALVATARSGG
jgi:acetyl esterase/lipase